jgi:hypothetical protein
MTMFCLSTLIHICIHFFATKHGDVEIHHLALALLALALFNQKLNKKFYSSFPNGEAVATTEFNIFYSFHCKKKYFRWNQVSFFLISILIRKRIKNFYLVVASNKIKNPYKHEN